MEKEYRISEKLFSLLWATEDSETLISFVESKSGDTRRIQDLRNALSYVDQIMNPYGRREERYVVNA